MRNNKVAYVAIALSLAIVFQLVEAIVPIPIPVPGVKLGIANVVALVLIVKVGAKEAVAVNILRVVFASILRGTIFGPTFYLAFAGAILASLAMLLAYRSRLFTMFGVSILAAAGHAVGQMIAIIWVFGTLGMLYYLPIILILSAVSGLLTGYIAASTLKRTTHIKIK